jgi:dTDP-glucose 4,6-dehydratase
VNGFIAALKSANGIGQVINLGSNFEVSIEETALLIAEIMGTSAKIDADLERIRPENSEIERLWADNSKANELFNWSPAFGGKDGFRKGLCETVNWFMQDGNLDTYKSDLYNL